MGYSELPDRFRNKVVANESSGCWEWTAATQKGYGAIRWGDGGKKLARAHRISYEAENGPIPEGLVIDHLCRNRCCVNPEHLEAVTHQENCARGHGGQWAKEEAARQTHCKHGHPRTDENTYTSKKGRKYCQICNLEAVRRYQLRKTG